MLRLLWSRYESTWHDISFLVAEIWRVIHDNPNIYPAVRRLVLVELSTVNRKHKSDVIFPNPPTPRRLQIVAPVYVVAINCDISTLEDFCSALSPIAHVSRTLG